MISPDWFRIFPTAIAAVEFDHDLFLPLLNVELERQGHETYLEGRILLFGDVEGLDWFTRSHADRVIHVMEAPPRTAVPATIVHAMKLDDVLARAKVARR